MSWDKYYERFSECGIGMNTASLLAWLFISKRYTLKQKRHHASVILRGLETYRSLVKNIGPSKY